MKRIPSFSATFLPAPVLFDKRGMHCEQGEIHCATAAKSEFDMVGL